MSGPQSRALSRIDAAIASARSAAEAACLIAQRAALLGQLGYADTAASALNDLRAHHPHNASMDLAVWLCLADGIVEYERNLPRLARDRITRAHAMAAAGRLRPLLALSAAWLAQIACSIGDISACAKHLTEAMQEATPMHHAARSRAALAAATAYHVCGRIDLARQWYDKARQHALAEGDDATVSTLMSTRACIEGEDLRIAAIFGSNQPAADESAIRRALMAAESSMNFDAYVKSLARRTLVGALRAQLLVLLGDFSGALSGLTQSLPYLEKEGCDQVLPVVLADMSWCRFRLGRNEVALDDAARAADALDGSTPERVHATVHGRLAQVFRGLGNREEATSHEERAQSALAHVRAQQAKGVTLLEDGFGRSSV